MPEAEAAWIGTSHQQLEFETDNGKGGLTNSHLIKPKQVWATLKEQKVWVAVVMFWVT